MKRKSENTRLQVLKKALVAAGITPEEIVLDYQDPDFRRIKMKPRLTCDLASVRDNWDLLS
jgi:hypothetical protein